MTRLADRQAAVLRYAAAAAWLIFLPGLCGGCLTPKIRYDEAAAPRPREAVNEEARGRFLVYTGDRRIPGDLESVVKLYRRPDGAEVLLVAMVHFADAGFYDEVSRRLAGSDVILFEGSAESGVAGGAAGDATTEAVEATANVFDALALVAQPDAHALGPTGPRYVRGDVDQKDLAVRVEAVKTAGGSWTAQEFPTGRFAWDRFWYTVVGRADAFRRSWRHLFATRLRPMDEPAVRAILIDPRNAALLAKVDEALAHRTRPAPERFRIAVPWGSEHMAGIERGLLARRFTPVRAERIVAWRIRSYLD